MEAPGVAGLERREAPPTGGRGSHCPQVVSVAVYLPHAQALPAMGWPWGGREGGHGQGCVEQGAKEGRQRSLPVALGGSVPSL